MGNFRVFVQARTTSHRFPGKVLAPLHGRPVIHHVIDRIALKVPRDCITVATSAEPSDDALSTFVKRMGLAVFRGPLQNVFLRFRQCLDAFPCEWFFRVCADSPVLDSRLFSKMLVCRDPEVDLITNVQTRTFPVGQSLELINSATFSGIDAQSLLAEEREHLTKFFYSNAPRFHIINLSSDDTALAQTSLAVDTPEDLGRLERLNLVESLS